MGAFGFSISVPLLLATIALLVLSALATTFWLGQRSAHAPDDATIGAVAALVGVALLGGSRLGGEFMPRLDEGSVLIQSRRLPSTALPQGVEITAQFGFYLGIVGGVLLAVSAVLPAKK